MKLRKIKRLEFRNTNFWNNNSKKRGSNSKNRGKRKIRWLRPWRTMMMAERALIHNKHKISKNFRTNFKKKELSFKLKLLI